MNASKKALAATVLVAAATAIIGAAAFANATDREEAPIHAHESMPPDPIWVNSDGTVASEKLPECIGAVGPNGKILLDESGREICIPADELFGPPPMPPPGNALDTAPTMPMKEGPYGEPMEVVPELRPAGVEAPDE